MSFHFADIIMTFLHDTKFPKMPLVTFINALTPCRRAIFGDTWRPCRKKWRVSALFSLTDDASLRAHEM